MSVPELNNADVKVCNSNVPSLELGKCPEILKNLFLRYSSLRKQADIFSSIPTRYSLQVLTLLQATPPQKASSRRTWSATWAPWCWPWNKRDLFKLQLSAAGASKEFSLLQPAQACPSGSEPESLCWVLGKGEWCGGQCFILNLEMALPMQSTDLIRALEVVLRSISHTHLCFQRPLTSQALQISLEIQAIMHRMTFIAYFWLYFLP